MAEIDGQGWHLDKRVPVSIIIVLIVQIAGGAWLASEMRGDINRNAQDVRRITSQAEVMRSTASSQAVQLGRIEENTNAMRGEVSRLTDTLTRERE